MKKSSGLSFLRIVIFVVLVLPLAVATASGTAPASRINLSAAGTAGNNQVTPAAAAVKKPISYDAYDGWRSIQGAQLSRDGQWLVYALVPQDGDGELVALNLKTNKEYRAARGKQPVLTVDGK
ncbi:MAG: hypothetical protein NT147_00680, partial [Candidatus Aminicenantes bacterium]|nr:hypothetical protein [Candidatus Aminicenantes bacterium]